MGTGFSKAHVPATGIAATFEESFMAIHQTTVEPSNISRCTQRSVKEPINDLRSRASFLGLPVELRCHIFEQALQNYEIDIASLLSKKPPISPSESLKFFLISCKQVNDEVRDWLRIQPQLKYHNLIGLFDPTTTIWKADLLTIRAQDTNFTRIVHHGGFKQYIQILAMDMNFDTSKGENKYRINDHDIWKKLLPLPSLQRIDLLMHGKLECMTKDGLFQRIWYPTTSCFSFGQCKECASKMPLIRWKNVNKVNGRWRELVNIDLGRQIAKDAAKSKEWCERNNVKWDGPEELEEFEDFSSEDDEADPEDIAEVKLRTSAAPALKLDSEVAMEDEPHDSDDESVYFSWRSHVSESESEDEDWDVGQRRGAAEEQMKKIKQSREGKSNSRIVSDVITES
ncbi:hypothetical protein IFR04_005769 [Cadophora malorum]|uniref:Uncharacterized protein n=1 Tax=Cadophora malorum TaxID=108018 RepID=A0A8H7TKL7_9HELO|nr:hypothetical protein IFR04_005769 [Cadophora malorum]